MSRPMYFDHEPGGLVARLCYCLPLADGRWVAYAHQETPQPDMPRPAVPPDRALWCELVAHCAQLGEVLAHERKRTQTMAALLAAITALLAAWNGES